MREKDIDPLQDDSREEVERIEFVEGDNKISFVLCRLKNRFYRMEIWLNGNTIRPASYPGRLSAYNFWNMFKKGLGK